MMVTGKKMEDEVEVGRYPCGVCGSGVGANSILCTVCERWCHKRCSGLRSLKRVVDFQCPACMWSSRGEVVKSMIEIDSGVRQVIKQVCYLEDILDSEGRTERAVWEREAVAWRKWSKTFELLMNRAIVVKRRGKI